MSNKYKMYSERFKIVDALLFQYMQCSIFQFTFILIQFIYPCSFSVIWFLCFFLSPFPDAQMESLSNVLADSFKISPSL